MSEILVTFSAIAGAQGDVNTAAARLNGQLGDLKAYLAPMVATWTGAAAENYNAKQRQWDEAAQALNEILAQIGRALGNAGDDFQSAEASNARMWA
jgi:WXG100 family type VII secretion target